MRRKAAAGLGPDIAFRAALRDDLPQLIALLADDRLGQGRERPGAADTVPQAYHAAFDRIAADPGQELLVMTLAGEIVGFCQLSLLPGLSHGGATRCQIESVRVRADRRGQGLGHRLIGEAVARARAAGCAMVQLSTHKTRTDAIRFYESMGFVASHQGMKLDLAAG